MNTLEEWDSKLLFGLGMVSIVVLLLIFCFGGASRAAAPVVEEHLSTLERKRLLNKYFATGKHRMVSIFL
jgi:hypothetical protein